MDFYKIAKETLERIRCVDGVVITQEQILEKILFEMFHKGVESVGKLVTGNAPTIFKFPDETI